MAAFESSEATSNIESGWVTIATLNADIETLNAFKDTVEATPVKIVLESVIVILTHIRVRLLVLLPFLHQLIGNTTRTR